MSFAIKNGAKVMIVFYDCNFFEVFLPAQLIFNIFTLKIIKIT